MEQDRTVYSEWYKPRKWYNNYSFPLVPTLDIKKANEYNTSGFTFHWLFLKLWSLDSFGFEIAFEIDTHWGIGFVAIVPYLRIVLCIPCPNKWQLWVYRNLHRTPPKSINPPKK